jgi:hypothetical protein
MIVMGLKQKNRDDLNNVISALLGKAVSAYFDSFIYLSAYSPEINKCKDSFVFKYSLYATQERLIIATKKLIEKSTSDKITMFSIRDIVERSDFCDNKDDKEGIKYIYTDRLQRLFVSEYAKRLKNMRDILCHNLCKKGEIGCYCKDFMKVIEECLDMLIDVREQVLGLRDIDLQQIKGLAYKLAKDYWKCIDAGAKETTITQKDLQLADSFMGNISKCATSA